jgi:hypothetical protein
MTCSNPECERELGPLLADEQRDPSGRCWWCVHNITPQPKPDAKELGSGKRK